MFGPITHITLINQLFKYLIIFERYFILKLVMAYLEFLFLFDLILVLRPREVINPFPDLPKSSFGYGDVIFIFSRLPNFNDISKVM